MISDHHIEGGGFLISLPLQGAKLDLQGSAHSRPSRFKSLTKVGSSKESGHRMEGTLISAAKKPCDLEGGGGGGSTAERAQCLGTSELFSSVLNFSCLLATASEPISR